MYDIIKIVDKHTIVNEAYYEKYHDIIKRLSFNKRLKNYIVNKGRRKVFLIAS